MAFSQVVDKLRRNFLFKLYKHHIIDSILIAKNDGMKALLRQRGKKFLFVICGYYLVRDSLVYIIIPMFIARGLF